MPIDTRRLADLAAHDDFLQRHNGPRQADVTAMLATLDVESLPALIERTVPADIRLGRELELDPPRSEAEALDYLKRSEERRVGKECRSGWSPYHQKEI